MLLQPSSNFDVRQLYGLDQKFMKRTFFDFDSYLRETDGTISRLNNFHCNLFLDTILGRPFKLCIAIATIVIHSLTSGLIILVLFLSHRRVETVKLPLVSLIKFLSKLFPDFDTH